MVVSECRLPLGAGSKRCEGCEHDMRGPIPFDHSVLVAELDQRPIVIMLSPLPLVLALATVTRGHRDLAARCVGRVSQ